MKSPNEIDFLVVGGGLAGSTMAYELLQKGFSVKIFHLSKRGEASAISSGVINPITGKRFVKTWNWDLLKTHFLPYYGQLGSFFNTQFLFPVQIKQILKSAEEENQWLSRCEDPEYGPLISFDSTAKGSNVGSSSHGWIEDAYRLDVFKLLTNLWHYFQELSVLESVEFDYKDLNVQSDACTYKNMQVKHQVIFAEGFWTRWNPYFKWLPTFAVKGERTIFESKITEPEIYKENYTLVPQEEKGVVWCGSNYEFDQIDVNPTESEKAKQILFYNAVSKSTGKLVDHLAGIRPAMKDRRPVIGLHPKYSKLSIINGYGTKGASLNPYCVKLLSEALTEFKTIPKEIHIDRFVKEYFLLN